MGGIRIVAIGGGGCSNHADPALDGWILSLARKSRPRIGFLGTASGDDPGKINGFRAAYAGRAEIAPLLSAKASAGAFSAWLGGLDLVYVGGGNLLKLLGEWQNLKWAEPLKAAACRGVLIAGVSAGAMCWFEQGFTNAQSNQHRGLKGLGFVPGSCCPHFSDEPERRPAFEAALRAGDVMSGIAIDDGVAVLCDEAGPQSFFTARRGHAAYRFSCPNGALRTEELPSWLSEG
jgi:peptidase E